jgi:putative sterol carrier protein
MASHTDAFFQELGSRGHEPALRSRTATIRFEIADGADVECHSVAIDKGDIAVTSPGDPAGADCTVRTGHQLFERIASGDANAMAAMLRGELIADGDPELLITARKLLATSAASSVPSPASSVKSAPTKGGQS